MILLTLLPTPARDLRSKLPRYNLQDWFLRNRMLWILPRRITTLSNGATGYDDHYLVLHKRSCHHDSLRLLLQISPVFCSLPTPTIWTTACGDLQLCDYLCSVHSLLHHDHRRVRTPVSILSHQVLHKASTRRTLPLDTTAATTSHLLQFCHSISHNNNRAAARQKYNLIDGYFQNSSLKYQSVGFAI